MKRTLAALLLASTPMLAHGQAVITQKNLSTAAAWAIAGKALACVQSHGWNTSIRVLDRTGETLVFVHTDNASPHTYSFSDRKAFSALTFKMPSGEFGDLLAKNPGRAAQASLPRVTTGGGGLPIKAGDTTIGSIGISGSPGAENDELCGREGISAVADQLK